MIRLRRRRVRRRFQCLPWRGHFSVSRPPFSLQPRRHRRAGLFFGRGAGRIFTGCTILGGAAPLPSARPVRRRGLSFARNQLHRSVELGRMGCAVKFYSVAFALVGASLLVSASDARARKTCPAFTPDEMKGCTYSNVDGCEVPCRKVLPGSVCPPPRDARYRCADGDWSFSQHDRGACSHHGGVRCTIGAGQNCCP
ncbi:DUF3761 domain-containing protein [Methylobacterium sp. NMS14P]|uniref:DUF3761 domain-containing protein n=1 Tax=Methylobacterium sp. NMS14P TaxID=2894310 RepID=UPI003FD2A8CC